MCVVRVGYLFTIGLAWLGLARLLIASECYVVSLILVYTEIICTQCVNGCVHNIIICTSI